MSHVFIKESFGFKCQKYQPSQRWKKSDAAVAMSLLILHSFAIFVLFLHAFFKGVSIFVSNFWLFFLVLHDFELFPHMFFVVIFKT